MGKLTGRRIVITGAAGAFGSAATELLEQHGARVIGLDLAEPTRADNLRCDITDPVAVRVAIAEAATRLGGIDVLVNNAGIGTASPLTDQLSPLEHAVFDVNLAGTWNVTAAALPHLVASKGHVVNLASMLAVLNFPFMTAYAASKRGVCAISDSLRVEYYEEGVTATTVYPGYVATAIHNPGEARTGLSLSGMAPEETVAMVARTIYKAIVRKPRDISTSRSGNFARRFARVFPGLCDRIIIRQALRIGMDRPAIWSIPAPGEAIPAGRAADPRGDEVSGTVSEGA